MNNQELLIQAQADKEKIKVEWETMRKERNRIDAEWTKFVSEFNEIYAAWNQIDAALDRQIKKIRDLQRLAKKEKANGKLQNMEPGKSSRLRPTIERKDDPAEREDTGATARS
jgi:hypothetical protein